MSGSCAATVCPREGGGDICQLRLDFASFAINGPTTVSDSVGKALFGRLVTKGNANANQVAAASQCLDDSFVATAVGGGGGGSGASSDVICGTNTDEHCA